MKNWCKKIHRVIYLQNEFEPVGAFQALSSWQVANYLCGGRILMAQMNFIFLFLTKYIHLWILKKEVEVDRILAGDRNKFIGKPDLRHSQ